MKSLLNKLKADELEILSKFLLDISKGILGAPLVVYFLKDFSVTCHGRYIYGRLWSSSIIIYWLNLFSSFRKQEKVK